MKDKQIKGLTKKNMSRDTTYKGKQYRKLGIYIDRPIKKGEG